jgi:hypothetical protein
MSGDGRGGRAAEASAAAASNGGPTVVTSAAQPGALYGGAAEGALAGLAPAAAAPGSFTVTRPADEGEVAFAEAARQWMEAIRECQAVPPPAYRVSTAGGRISVELGSPSPWVGLACTLAAPDDEDRMLEGTVR